MTDGRDRLLPLVASAFVLSPADDDAIAIETSAAMPEDMPKGTEVNDARRGDDARRVWPDPNDPDDPNDPNDRFPTRTAGRTLAPPPRAPRPTSRAPRLFGGGDRSASSARLAGVSGLAARARASATRPLGMCFEYLNNCMRPAKRNRKKSRARSSPRETNAVWSSLDDAADASLRTFTAYGGDGSGAGMHQDVDTIDDTSGALETARAHLEACAAETRSRRTTPAANRPTRH